MSVIGPPQGAKAPVGGNDAHALGQRGGSTDSPRIALIHATPLAVEPIRQAFERHWPRAQRMNLLDDSLSADRARDGQLTGAMTQRFIDLARYARGTGCTGILFTCSAFGPAIEAAGAATGLPTLKPNEAMFDEALALALKAGDDARVGLVATFEASIPSMSGELLALASQRGQRIRLVTALAAGAMQDLAQGHADAHDRKVADAVRTLGDCAVVMLAQFSMAAALPAAEAVTTSPVLSSPDCAVLSLQQRMNHV